ncbi:glycoside hydrolase family 2 TIM barrel-domain containing protein [Telluria antibiotica]|uniref:glycoside hydrolase family 2 TIM barrel-domain containing protein n=1 Tax=Telluria antibiotica TaxID=2717319 RepID=UPI001E512679|nr:glycoside hydrolase family 2 TIM barrel-domain containing protein [Telluria antibiotica]
MHLDLGALGAAFNYRAAERPLETMRDMGVNAVRFSHNPPAPEMLELCDRMGILAVDEIFDTWEAKKTNQGLQLQFPDWHEADLRATIRRDRNHPSVLMWSVGKGVQEQRTARGVELARELVGIAHDTPVHVFSSGDEAELFVNGKSQGRIAKLTERSPYEYRFRRDEMKYEPGEVAVVVYKDKREWARDVVRTEGPPARLAASVDRAHIRAGRDDLAFVTVRIADASGATALRAGNRGRFRVAGPGEIVATDNGDQTEMEPFRTMEKRAFNGLVLAIVRAKPGKTGHIVVYAEADGLAPDAVDIAIAQQ